jgi:hypothetical protein
MERIVSNRSAALFDAVLSDVSEYLPFGPVGLGSIPPDASYKQFASSYLVSSVIKKMIPKDSSKQDLVAKEKFLTSNKKCKDWNLSFNDEFDFMLFSSFKDELHDFFHHRDSRFIIDSWADICSEGRCGPGSSVGSLGNSFYAKLWGSDLTFTSYQLYDMYIAFIKLMPQWAEADCLRYAHGHRNIKVNGSRSSFVPKTDTVSRMICIEPTLNMFFQLGIGSIMTRRLLSRFKIDLSRQPSINQRLAYLGSKNDWFCTIDLESASDSISVRLCESILPKYIFDILLNTRSHTTELSGEIVPLNMISTMGNGFTFPLQTIIFSCIVATAYRLEGFDPFDEVGKSWSVFGDDIICRKETYGHVTRLLRICGFTTNIAKSFSIGPFRESCGSDWFQGQPVRPVFIKKLDSKQDIFVAINLLNEWTAYTGIPLQKAVTVLRKMLHPAYREQFVPFDSDFSSGIRVPLAICHKHPKRDKNLSFLFRSDEPRPFKMLVSDTGLLPESKFGRLGFNPPGLYLSFLLGELKSYSFNVRHDNVRYRTKLRVCPFWDHIPTGRLSKGISLSWQQWETAVLRNWSNP